MIDDQELYKFIMDDPTARQLVDKEQWVMLYRFIFYNMKRLPEPITMSELMTWLQSAGIDTFSNGTVPEGLFAGDPNMVSFNFKRITKIGKMAFFKSGITRAKLSGVKEIESGAFCGTPLTSVTLGSTLEAIGDYAFMNSNITELYIPPTCLYIGRQAFANTPLKELFLDLDPNSDYSYKIDGSAFDMTRLQALYMHAGAMFNEPSENFQDVLVRNNTGIVLIKDDPGTQDDEIIAIFKDYYPKVNDENIIVDSGDEND